LLSENKARASMQSEAW